ncbi:MAG: hypothetical protein HYX68_18140 [Planctomycetes bacterium]|nr:hypothetical protein [Planctomycetota bacterium]
MKKSLDEKLARIHADPHGAKDFILADAKDPDMALGLGATGRAQQGTFTYRSLREFREQIEQIVEQGLVDIMLMSAHTNEILTIQRRIFDNSRVTPAARANDTTDIHVMRGGRGPMQPALPFRTATLDHIQCGHGDCADGERHLGANLGLYSITFQNDNVIDREALERYKEFRIEAEQKGFRHFLEIFDPNRPESVEPTKLPDFINDAIVRTLAGVATRGRPLFLKMVYHGPRAMEELVHYDPHLIVGILGGSAGTTYDAFKLLAEAKKYGARVALFGRKINNAENQLAFVRFLRWIADGEITPEEAVKAYHGVLQGLGIKPLRSLDEDMVLQTNVMSYGGDGKTIRAPKAKPGEPSRVSARVSAAEPDFSKMTPAEKVAYHRARWQRILG